MAVQFNNQGDSDRWWGIGQKLGYTGKQDGSGGLGTWLDQNNLRSTAENHFNSNSTPSQSTAVRPVGMVEPLNDWQKQYATNQATGAPVTGDMSRARGLLESAGNVAQSAKYDFNAQPYVSGAQGYTAGSTRTFGQDDAQRLMDPYIGNVVDTTNKELVRQRGLLQNGLNSQFSNAGAYGSARQGVYDAEADRNTMDQISRNTAGLLSQGYNNAQSMFNQERGRDASAAGQTLQTGQYGMSDAMNRFNAPLQQASAMSGIANADVNLRNNYLNQWQQGQTGILNAGNMVQGQNQKEVDAYNSERLGDANWNRNSVDWYGGALGKFPSGQTQTPYQPNTMQTLGSAGMIGAGLLSSYGSGGNSNMSANSMSGNMMLPSSNPYYLSGW